MKVFKEAKELLASDDPKKRKEGGVLLLRAHKGLPKYKPLIKFLSEEGNKAMLLKTENEYMQVHGDAPTADQLADILQMDKSELKEAMEAKQASATTSFSMQAEDEDGYAPELYVGKADSNLDSIELKKDLKAAMEDLNEQQKQIIYYRYFEDLTQSKIASMLGISQMQVSRMEKAALQKIREKMHVADDR